MDARTIDNLAAVDSTKVNQQWNPGIYRLTGGKWK